MGTNYSVEIGALDPVHLGKKSAGWSFLFRGQKQWEQGHAFSNWIMLATMGPITDEYGRTVELIDLLEIIIRARDARKHEDSGVHVYTNCGFEFTDSEFC